MKRKLSAFFSLVLVVALLALPINTLAAQPVETTIEFVEQTVEMIEISPGIYTFSIPMVDPDAPAIARDGGGVIYGSYGMRTGYMELESFTTGLITSVRITYKLSGNVPSRTLTQSNTNPVPINSIATHGTHYVGMPVGMLPGLIHITYTGIVTTVTSGGSFIGSGNVYF